MLMAQETGKPASGELDSEGESATTKILKTDTTTGYDPNPSEGDVTAVAMT